jgi:hypothetical protein
VNRATFHPYTDRARLQVLVLLCIYLTIICTCAAASSVTLSGIQEGMATSSLDTAKSEEPKVSDRKEESTQKLVCLLAMYSLMAVSVTFFLFVHIRRQSDRWMFDVLLLVACLAYARSYALRLLMKD